MNIKNLTFALTAVAVLGPAVGCGKRKEPSGSDIKAKAEEVLRQMTDFYKDSKSFSFELRTEFSGTIAQDYEETMSLVSTYAVKVQRPERVSMKLISGKTSC